MKKPKNKSKQKCSSKSYSNKKVVLATSCRHSAAARLTKIYSNKKMNRN